MWHYVLLLFCLCDQISAELCLLLTFSSYTWDYKTWIDCRYTLKFRIWHCWNGDGINFDLQALPLSYHVASLVWRVSGSSSDQKVLTSLYFKQLKWEFLALFLDRSSYFCVWPYFWISPYYSLIGPIFWLALLFFHWLLLTWMDQ